MDGDLYSGCDSVDLATGMAHYPTQLGFDGLFTHLKRGGWQPCVLALPSTVSNKP